MPEARKFLSCLVKKTYKKIYIHKKMDDLVFKECDHDHLPGLTWLE